MTGICRPTTDQTIPSQNNTYFKRFLGTKLRLVQF
jgi:hypothetical protein